MFPAILGLVLVAAGCGGDDPNCRAADRGRISFIMAPFVEDQVNTFSGVFQAEDFLFTDPPVIRYTFRRDTDSSAVTIQIDDIGYGIPLEVGTRYTVRAQKGTILKLILFSHALSFTDDRGLKALIVTDWLPNYSLYKISDRGEGGYPLGLKVFQSDLGCAPRVSNTKEYRDITNQRLDFEMGDRKVKLYHNQAGKLGDYDVEVFRSEKVVAKINTSVMNQISFALSRRETP